MWELLFDWKALVQVGIDAAGYALFAIVATLLFLLRLGLALAGGGDDGGDFETDADVHADASFTFFSVLSILAFFMGAGWMGLAARLDWELGRLPSALLSVGFGTLMMLAASAMMYGVRKLNREVGYDLGTAVGHTGRAYLPIPAKGTGLGQVEVTVSGRKKILRAASAGPAIPSFQDVRVLEVRDDETLIVEPLG
jgi:hypothetical protein